MVGWRILASYHFPSKAYLTWQVNGNFNSSGFFIPNSGKGIGWIEVEMGRVTTSSNSKYFTLQVPSSLLISRITAAKVRSGVLISTRSKTEKLFPGGVRSFGVWKGEEEKEEEEEEDVISDESIVFIFFQKCLKRKEKAEREARRGEKNRT